MDAKLAQYEPHVRKAWASVHLELTRVAREKRVLRKRSPQKKQYDDITFHPKPRGRAPEGKSWDPIHGEWTDTSPTKVKQANQKKKNETSSVSQSQQSPNPRNKTNKSLRTKGEPKAKPSNDTKRKTRSASKATAITTTSPLNTLQRQSARKAILETATTTRVQMPSPKRLESTLEENMGGFLAREATPPSPVKHRNTSSHPTSSPNKPLMIQKGDALATLWGAPKGKPSMKKTTEAHHKSRTSDPDTQHHRPLDKTSGGLLAEISNTRKRNVDVSKDSNKRDAKKPRLTKTKDITKGNPDGIRESKRPLVQREDGTFARPPGKSPAGFSWDEQGGAWVAQGNATTSQTNKSLPKKSDERKASAIRTEPPKQPQKTAKTTSKSSANAIDDKIEPKQSQKKGKSSSRQTTEEQRAPISGTEPHKQSHKKAKTSTKQSVKIPNSKVANSASLTMYDAKSGTRQSANLPSGDIRFAASPTKSSAREAKRTEKYSVSSNKEKMSSLAARSSPSSTKDRHRSQHAGLSRSDYITENGVQRRIVPTDSLYSPAKSESSMQHESKASARASPRAEYGWDDDKEDSAPHLDSPAERMSSRKRKEPERADQPLQSALKQPRLARGTTSSPGNRFNRSPRFDAAISMLTSTAFHSSARNGFHTSSRGTPDGSQGSNRSPSGRPRKDPRRRSLQFVAHTSMNVAQTATTTTTESRDYVACGDCLNCRLPINCGACLLCKNSLHFGSLFPSCVRRICVSPVLPPLQRVSMVHFSASKNPVARSPSTPIGSPPRRSPVKKLAASGSGVLGSFGKYRDKDEQSMDESEPAPSKASVQTDDITDVVESLHPDSDDDISDF